MLGAYASAILICIVSVIVGRAICAFVGHVGSTWLGAPVGFAALMIVCQVAIRLPGHGWTAVVAVVVLCAASVWISARRRATWPAVADALPVALVVLIYVSVPFLANARVGVLGISLLNDTRVHLLLAEALLKPSISLIGVAGPGYPVGPHAVMATFAQGLGTSVDRTLSGLLIAVPVLTGLAALGALTDVSRPRRWLVAVFAAIPYLAAAWYIQSAFKEPILSLFLLGLVIALQTGRRDRFARPAAVSIPIGLLVAGILYDYSYPGLVWPVAIVGCWLAAELVLGGAWRRLPSILPWVWRAAPALAIALLLLVVVVAPDLQRMHAFWLANGGTAVGTAGGANGVTTTSLADLAGPLRAAEGLNVWLSGNFRIVPADTLRAGVLIGLALIVLAFALASALERHDLCGPPRCLAWAWCMRTPSTPNRPT